SSLPGSPDSPKAPTSLPTVAAATAFLPPTRSGCCGNAASPPGRWREGCPTGGSPGCPSPPGPAHDRCHPPRPPIPGRPGGRCPSASQRHGEGARVPPPPTPMVLDGGDRACVALLLELQARISGLPAGTVIHLIAADPAAPIDLPAWCHLTGQCHG